MNSSAVLPSLPSAQVVSQLAKATAELPGLNGERPHLDRLAQDYARGVDQFESSIVVAFIGSTGAGKSTLLNALSGASLAEEGTQRPTSTHPVVYAPADAIIGPLVGPSSKVVRYQPRSGAAWTGQVFVDTPDLNSVATEHRERTREVLEQADVALVVMHKGAVVEATQAEFLATFARRRRLVFVLNFADELAPASREALKGQAARVAASVLKLAPEEVQVFAVSAAEARKGRDPSGEWPAFIATLQSLGEEAGREKVRRSNAVGILRELGELTAPVLQRLDASRSKIDGALATGLSKARDAFRDDFRQRLSASRAHLSNEVKRRASSHWWGPAAAWMRLSMLGASGLGAATLLGRRNLPVGLAVAAVSTAVDKLKEHTLATTAERHVVVEENPALVQNVRAAVAFARSAAAQEGIEPSKLSLPSAEELLETLRGVREGAWAYAERDAVEHAVSRWWTWARWLLVPLVNLPLFALLGHVAFNVARAYLVGPLLSASYFINAAAFAVILSIFGGVLASLTLSRVASKVRSLGQARYDAAVDSLLEQSKAKTSESFFAWTQPAQRISDIAREFF